MIESFSRCCGWIVSCCSREFTEVPQTDTRVSEIAQSHLGNQTSNSSQIVNASVGAIAPSIGRSTVEENEENFSQLFWLHIDPLQNGKMRIEARDSITAFCSGYAVAMLHISYQNKKFAKLLMQEPNPELSTKSLKILENAANAKSPADFQRILTETSSIQSLTKELQILCETGLQDEPLSEITLESLQALMNKTGIPITVEKEGNHLFFHRISYGKVVLEEGNSVVYVPARGDFISSLYRKQRLPHKGLLTFFTSVRAKEIEVYQQIKDRPNLILPPDVLSTYQLLCKRGKIFEENTRVLEESEVQTLLEKEDSTLMQITSNPASQSSLLQISGIGNFQYFSEVDPNDICSLRSKYHRNWRSNTSLTYYHKTETSHNSGHGAVKHSTQSDCSYMEDRSLVTTFLMPALDAEPILLAGVFDGHGGEKCSEHIEANLSSVLQKYLLAFSDAKNYPNFTLDAIVCNALKQTLVELDYTFNENKGGSTATVSVKIGNVLYTANVGDSRTILVAPTQWKQLSLDAEANQDPHSTIIQKLGGTFTKNRDEDSYRISHDIAMGSSIGDHSTIGTNPTVTFSKTDLTQYPDAVLVAVSDGATDVATSHEIAQAIQGTYFPENGLSLPDTAVALGYSFYKNESQDNITVVMVDLSRLTGF